MIFVNEGDFYLTLNEYILEVKKVENGIATIKYHHPTQIAVSNQYYYNNPIHPSTFGLFKKLGKLDILFYI